MEQEHKSLSKPYNYPSEIVYKPRLDNAAPSLKPVVAYLTSRLPISHFRTLLNAHTAVS